MTTSTAPLIHASGLAILRGERVLFRGIGLTLAPGEAIVLRGANGAGKTTLLRMLAGLTRAEAGDISRPLPHHWVGHKEGIKPQETPREHLALWAQAWGSTAKIPEILEKMALTRAADVPGRYLSAGQRRRTAFARLMLEDRPLWLLDEPYTALDADGRKLLDNVILRHLEAKGGLIASMHDHSGFPVSREVTL
ncbi:heme ABC exporter ATP-binding protein CcmA [Hyphomonas sp. WL0036]|uniref:heme ABC exporter ATP-binding protein CcmA n=1 Tax=Hyphomonas sediminis TaxID=2866160 RepID=UPI001C7EC0F6|nr:heme ABC exporter ATP-binding protein CcmA [Hyphomonas sediminis]